MAWEASRTKDRTHRFRAAWAREGATARGTADQGRVTTEPRKGKMSRGAKGAQEWKTHWRNGRTRPGKGQRAGKAAGPRGTARELPENKAELDHRSASECVTW